ncbi:lysozyme inhibitor LprI family protein [Pectobacterium brasiliense]|uniref:lysozyme inhibitor LprI family protein n=1 Tax=Pectobacterium brasiliense TaxID=180957 RepID=UPI002A7FBB5A|nr:lysozyme inhibitor LprI family protein [Pectobacterium brasiliense]MDY4367505.1 lysozyme inhibitor LprI family protein [Pectobacterium brasiliense]MDY7057036.1 lysozyme inhibitor LprI family protein [Pectobacterium brasiliense]
MRYLSLTVSSLLLFFTSSVWAMDCSKASTDTEKMICASSQLQQLDAVLNKAYQGYVKKEDKTQALQAQRAWLAERDRCKDDVCLGNAMVSRIQTLSGSENISLITKASDQWDFVLGVAKCNLDPSYPTCEGPGTLDIFKKGSGGLFQRITMENMFIELNKKGETTVNLVEVYGENNSGLVIDDANFDHHADIILRNGNNGAYGGPSYDVYLFDVEKQQFTLNAPLTELASSNLGLFEIDDKRKTITTSTKSGCCWHQSSTYQIANNKPVLIAETTEEYSEEKKAMVATTRELVGGKWNVEEKIEKSDTQ